MNVQFAGTLQYQLQLSEVLRRVMEAAPEPLSALLLNDEQNGRHGTICISQGRFVSGAELKNAEYERICTGYEALKIIASLVSANFKYITAPPQFFENTELTLNIEIEKLLLCLPELPANISELQDSDSLLDRVFSVDEMPMSGPVELPKPAPPEAKKKKSTWHSVPVSRAAEVFAVPAEDEEAETKYSTIEERALAELGPPGVKKMRKKKPLAVRFVQRIGYFFYSLYTAPVHMLRKLGKPVILPLVAIAVVYQAWMFFSPKFHGLKLPTPSVAKHPTTAPDHVSRSAPVYHAPVAHHSAASAHATSANTITITQPVVEPKTIVPYTTPENPPNYPHRRAFQTVPQAHNNAIIPHSSAATSSEPHQNSTATEPPHLVPSTN